jgi:amino-acid N-acetyltransferase
MLDGLRVGAACENRQTRRSSCLRPLMHELSMIRARPSRSAAVAFLEGEGLPVTDLIDEHLEQFFFVGSEDAPSGLVGLEIFGTDALLRSLAVAASARSQGLGTALVKHAEDHASAQGVRTIYLLTMTAQTFFERRGYRRAERIQAPPSIQSTREFASLCPASAAFMSKQL